MIIAPGVFTDMSNEVYHNDVLSISRSALIDFAKSPFNYWSNHINPARPEKEISAAMEFGTAFHTFILEPEKFHDDYQCLPQKVLLKDVGREAYDDYKKECDELVKSHKIILSQTDFELLIAMQKAIYEHDKAWKLIENAVYEQSHFWQDKDSELIVKCRPDILQTNMIIDLKTCADASERAMQHETFARGYDIQAAMMREGIYETTSNRIDNFILLCVEKKYPYNIGIHIIDETVIDRAELIYKNLLIRLKECHVNNNWPGYPISTIGLPKWLT